jgi:chromosome segregation ATPase
MNRIYCPRELATLRQENVALKSRIKVNEQQMSNQADCIQRAVTTQSVLEDLRIALEVFKQEDGHRLTSLQERANEAEDYSRTLEQQLAQAQKNNWKQSSEVDDLRDQVARLEAEKASETDRKNEYRGQVALLMMMIKGLMRAKSRTASEIAEECRQADESEAGKVEGNDSSSFGSLPSSSSS